MSNSIGKNIVFTLFGESHGGEIGVVADGLPAGLVIDNEFIKLQLSRRRPAGSISTARREADEYRIVSGAFNGKTTGAPLCLLIPNKDVRSSAYEFLKETPRPGHADYTAAVKYGGFADYRGGGHFSGRLTAPLTAMGALLMPVLKARGIDISAHIYSVGDIKDRPFIPTTSEMEAARQGFPTIDEAAGESIKEYIKKAADSGDSVGGIIEIAVTGFPAGVGEPWFDGVENSLARALFGIPAVKGVEFGLGFGFGNSTGSQANDAFSLEKDKVVTKTNNNGGINGGISNGMPLIYRIAVKPTPSIYKEQKTLNLVSGKEETLKIEGRHDPAIIHRAIPVAESVSAMVLCDLLCEQFGKGYLLPREVVKL